MNCTYRNFPAFYIAYAFRRAKYPLATTNFLLDVFGPDVGLGADIGCSFIETVKHSVLLKDKASRLRLQVVVNAFHGWAHNHLCQLQYHPLYRKGAGLEDLETLERIFSASNTIAQTIHHATKFHWLQAVDLHFRQWDEQKYQELSKFTLRLCYSPLIYFNRFFHVQ